MSNKILYQPIEGTAIRSDGAANTQVLTADGNGSASWQNAGGASNPVEYNAGNSGTSTTINWGNGTVQALTLTGNVTISFSGGTGTGPYTLRTYNNGGFSVAFSPTSGTGKIIFQSALLPAPPTTTGDITFWTFYYDGTYWYLTAVDYPYNQADFTNSKSVLLDGISKYLTAGSNFQFDRTQPYLFSAWVRPTVVGSFNLIASNLDSSNNYIGCFNFYFDTDNKLYAGVVHNNSNNQLYAGTNAVVAQLNTWVHICIKYDGLSANNSLTFYVNGTVAASTLGGNTLSASTVTTAPFTLGKRSNGAYFTGNINQVSLWTTITSVSAADLYNSGHPGNLMSLPYFSDCAAWWYLVGPSDTTSTVYDHANSYNLTPTNIVSGDYVTTVP